MAVKIDNHGPALVVESGGWGKWGLREAKYTYNGTDIWVIALTLLVPYLIVLLSLSSQNVANRVLRAGLAPVGIWGMWEMFRTYRTIKPNDVQMFELSMACTLSVTLRYTLTLNPPSFHPLPRQPPLGFLRRNRFFTAFNLVASDYRHINIPPNPSLKPGRSYFRSVIYHLGGFILHITLMDLLLYPGYLLDPTGLGSPTAATASTAPNAPLDLVGFCFRPDRSTAEGLALWVWFALALGLGIVCATMGCYHLYAFLGIASGVYSDEEWPKFMDQPWKAQSLNELWGKRYHQLLRDTFLLWAYPFSGLPKPIYTLSIFLASALFHAIIYKSASSTSQFILIPYLTFYLLQGLGCLLERKLYHWTGKRVGGWMGRAWMVIWLLLTGAPMIGEYYKIGWAGGMRGALVEGGTSPTAWIAYGLGYAPHP